MLSLTAFAGSASASPHNGFVGACNMVAAWPGLGPGQGVGVKPGGGMENAMKRNVNGNGNVGMDNAILKSGGTGTC
jgi:hypothetical protein